MLQPTADGRLAVTGHLTPEQSATIRANRDALRDHLRDESRGRELLGRFDTLDERDLDRLVVLGLGYFNDADLERLNLALTRRAGLDRPPEGPIRL